MKKIFEHDLVLGHYLYEELNKIEGLKLYGPKPRFTPHEIISMLDVNSEFIENLITSRSSETEGIRTGLVSFNSDSIHPTDLSFFLDREGVALRTGHHCTQPLHKYMNVSASIRASVYLYNDSSDVDLLIAKLKETIIMFQNLNPS